MDLIKEIKEMNIADLNYDISMFQRIRDAVHGSYVIKIVLESYENPLDAELIVNIPEKHNIKFELSNYICMCLDSELRYLKQEIDRLEEI